MQITTTSQDNFIRWFLAAGAYFICLIAFYIDIGQDMGAKYFMPILVPVIASLILMQYGSRIPLFSKATLPNLLTGLLWCAAFPLLYTGLVKPGVLTLEALVALLCERPRERFGLPLGDDWSLWDLETEYTIDPADFLSKGKASPFTGRRVFGRCLQTVYSGQTVYREK